MYFRKVTLSLGQDRQHLCNYSAQNETWMNSREETRTGNCLWDCLVRPAEVQFDLTPSAASISRKNSSMPYLNAIIHLWWDSSRIRTGIHMCALFKNILVWSKSNPRTVKSRLKLRQENCDFHIHSLIIPAYGTLTIYFNGAFSEHSKSLSCLENWRIFIQI